MNAQLDQAVAQPTVQDSVATPSKEAKKEGKQQEVSFTQDVSTLGDAGAPVGLKS